MNALRTAVMLVVLLGAALTTTPPPAAARDCETFLDCALDSTPTELPITPPPEGIVPCGLQPCMIEVPQACDVPGDPCRCGSLYENFRGEVCGVDPCATPQSPCGCLNVAATTTALGGELASGSCGISVPSGPADSCERLEETCGCTGLVNAPVVTSASGEVCGVSNPCPDPVQTGSGPGLPGTLGQLGSTTPVTGNGLVPTSACGVEIPRDPCAGTIGALACGCLAQLPPHTGDGGSTLLPTVRQGIVPIPDCVGPADGSSPVCGEYVPDPSTTDGISGVLFWLENAPKQVQHCLAAGYCGSAAFPETMTNPPQLGQTKCCPSQYAPMDYFRVVDAAGGQNFQEWILQLVHYTPGMSVDHRVGWNNQVPQTYHSVTHFLRTGANLASPWMTPYTHVSETEITALCGEVHDTHCIAPCSLDVMSHFSGLDKTEDFASSTTESHTVSWGVSGTSARTWEISRSGPTIGGSTSFTLEYGESGTHTWSDEVRTTYRSQEHTYHGTFTA